ncbi:F0F1 ATP synthase subunit A [Bailinhaonella thermotolerans]|uniref:ATP synthase subunit a n=1 Tax=Bailinhaonella thermotolerans TaxID=1070861 RepID=A0A3A4AD25_9ACTN|nr:F0F1 ATP synthase subunit A [Bailinhaonella thermotolerans]RJL24504.1 ATP synthase F0 subunit A [Bailinhaonella thermotolerans]
MSALTVLATSPGGGEFHAPGLELFQWDSFAGEGGPTWFAKPALLASLGVLILIVVAFASFAKPKMVPRGVQGIGELGYLFVRDQIARPFLGKDADRFMPFLFSLFFFVWIMNLFGVIPVAQLPVTSRMAFPAVLALMVYVMFLYYGIKTQGFGGFLKNMTVPPGLPKWVYIMATPIEFLSTFILRPFTHAVRLMGNMLAGHILLALFSVVAYHFLVEQLTPLGAPVGVLGVVMTIVFTAFEMFIQFLQAYVFAFLASMFLGEALHPAH